MRIRIPCFDDGRGAGIIRKDIPVIMMIEIMLGAIKAVLNSPKLEEFGLTVKSGFSSVIPVILKGATILKKRLKLCRVL
jgi:hypothetical protein